MIIIIVHAWVSCEKCGDSDSASCTSFSDVLGPSYIHGIIYEDLETKCAAQLGPLDNITSSDNLLTSRTFTDRTYSYK